MYDAIVVAGGSARRLDGADKPGLEVGGRSLLDHVLAAVGDAQRLIVVGPRRATEVEVVWTREDPPGGGPVAAIAAAVPHLRSPVVLVLAADLPAVAPAVAPLLAALDGHEVAVLSTDARDNPLAAAWSTDGLRAAVAGLPDTAGAAARSLLAGRDVVRVADVGGWGIDCDTWADVTAARDRLG